MNVKKSLPHLNFEQELWDQGYLVCGIDEVGRGCFAGPLVVGAVILKKPESLSDLEYVLHLGINDSKLVSPKKREQLKKISQELILAQTIISIPVELINKKGVGVANKLGFQKAALEIRSQIKDPILRVRYLTDAFKIPGVPLQDQKNIIRGDATSISIALASILAKLERDCVMENLARVFPTYGFEKHKGYGTLYHRTQLKEFGPCIEHRTEFIKHYI